LAEQDLDLNSVADFYAAPWLHDFPQGTTWYASGLDDGAEQFYAVIEFRGYRLSFDVGTITTLRLIVPPQELSQTVGDKLKL
jgi:hypothetical protein